MKFIVGLGNPGRKYSRTPHNVGFEVVDRLASPDSAWRRKFKAEYAEQICGDEKVLLIKPQTYMNLSGEAVQGMLGYFRGTPKDLLVVYDDLDLPLGRLRFRAQGSSGGHRGIASIIQSIGSSEFDRLKIGIALESEGEARDGSSDLASAEQRERDAADYVLTPFSSRVRADVDGVLERAAAAVEVWIHRGIEESAQEYN